MDARQLGWQLNSRLHHKSPFAWKSDPVVESGGQSLQVIHERTCNTRASMHPQFYSLTVPKESKINQAVLRARIEFSFSMPTIHIVTSASPSAEESRSCIHKVSDAASAAAGVPLSYVHVHLQTSQMMTWGGVLGDTSQIRVLTLWEQLSTEKRQEFANSAMAALSSWTSPHRSQIFFQECHLKDLAIEGKILSADSAAAAAAAASENALLKQAAP